MKCIALLCCEKLIVDKDGAHSIINVMVNAKVSLQQGNKGEPLQDVSVPLNAIMPTQWWIYAQWMPSREDVGKSFEQVYQVYWPNDEKLTENRVPFKITEDSMHQVTFSFIGFPVGQPGNVKILTWLDSGGHRVSDVSETRMRVTHVTTQGSVLAPLPS